MADGARAIALQPGEGVTLLNPVGGDVTFKVRANETEGRMTAFETVVAPADGPPLHTHANEDEVVYVLEGTVEFRLGDDHHRSSVGSFVFIPRRTVHAFRNVGDAPARMLIVFAPSGMERFFELTAAARTRSEDHADFAAAGREVGMDVVGPPLAAAGEGE